MTKATRQIDRMPVSHECSDGRLDSQSVKPDALSWAAQTGSHELTAVGAWHTRHKTQPHWHHQASQLYTRCCCGRAKETALHALRMRDFVTANMATHPVSRPRAEINSYLWLACDIEQLDTNLLRISDPVSLLI